MQYTFVISTYSQFVAHLDHIVRRKVVYLIQCLHPHRVYLCYGVNALAFSHFVILAFIHLRGMFRLLFKIYWRAGLQPHLPWNLIIFCQPSHRDTGLFTD